MPNIKKLNTSPSVFTVVEAAKELKVAKTGVHYFFLTGDLPTKYTLHGIQEVFASQSEVARLKKKRIKEGKQ